MLTEREIVDCHIQALKEAKDACFRLGQNADPTHLAPRGHQYTRLRSALTRLEGSARQMCHWRQDARWVRLGIYYAKVMRTAQVKFVGQKWGDFAKMTGIFDAGLRNMQDLVERKTGTLGPILPSQPTDWLVLPDLRIPRPHHFQSVH